MGNGQWVIITPITYYLLPITYYPLPITYYLLPITYYPLPITYYLLPITYYLLPITYYPLPITYLYNVHNRAHVHVFAFYNDAHDDHSNRVRNNTPFHAAANTHLPKHRGGNNHPKPICQRPNRSRDQGTVGANLCSHNLYVQNQK